MKKNLESKLYSKYHNIFKDIDARWRLECGDGWYSIIDNLCAGIDMVLNEEPTIREYIKALQVKSKSGLLKVYMNHNHSKIVSLVTDAEIQSESVCEICGLPGRLISDCGWYVVRCEKCLPSKNL